MPLNRVDTWDEYAATNESYMHYDAFRWQAGSFLIAGVFIFWGLLIQQSPVKDDKVITMAAGLVAGLMSIWLLFAHHYRQIYMLKLHRLWELERSLGGRQHLRFAPDLFVKDLQDFQDPGATHYGTVGPPGHWLDIATFAVTSLGTIALGDFALNRFDGILLMPLALIAPVVIAVLIMEYKLQEKLRAAVARSIASETSHG